MLNFFQNTCARIFQQCSAKIRNLFKRGIVDEHALLELEQILIEADTGSAATKKIINELKDAYRAGKITTSEQLQDALVKLLHHSITDHQPLPEHSSVYLLVGVNGTGKTTLAAKLAYQEKNKGEKVLLVAGDTFRAAAQEQLLAWAQKLQVDIVQGPIGSDPAALVFQGCQKFIQGKYTRLIIDTAGRLQTKTNLMKELAKIKRVINTQLPEAPVHTMLTIDTMLGQNSLEQARVFHESTQVDSFVLTKMDGTGKGGIVCALVQNFHIPISYLTVGEHPQDLKTFNSDDYIHNLLGIET